MKTIRNGGGNIADISLVLMKCPRAVKVKNSEIPILARVDAAVLTAAVQRPSRVSITRRSARVRKVIAPDQRAAAISPRQSERIR